MKKNYKVGELVRFKKKHPCGSDIWKIIRVGMDFKTECTGCGRIITMSRKNFVKAVKEKVDKDQ